MSTDSLTTKASVRVSLTIARMKKVQDLAANNKSGALERAMKVACDLTVALEDDRPKPQAAIKTAISALQKICEDLEKAEAMERIADEAMYELVS